MCGEQTQLPMVTPCAHLMCTDCTATSRTACPVCGAGYSMQAVDDPARYKNNPNPKWEVRAEAAVPVLPACLACVRRRACVAEAVHACTL